MIEKIPLSKIRGNPFFSRSKKSEAVSEESINMLAAEIKKLGWFGGPFKARKRDGKYEIAFGHRRVEALRRLGRDAVELDIEELTDKDMQLYVAVENFQRHALTDQEKLQLWEMVKKHSGGSQAEAAKLLGIGRETAQAYDRALEYAKEGIPSRGLSPRDLLEADRFAGKEGVAIAGKKNLDQHRLRDIRESIYRASEYTSSTGERKPNPKTKERLIERFKQGDISSADDVPRVARKIAQEEFEERVKAARKKVPADLLEIVAQWVEDLPEIIEKLQVIAGSKEYAEYVVEGNPRLAAQFKGQLRKLLAVTARLEKMILPRLE